MKKTHVVFIIMLLAATYCESPVLAQGPGFDDDVVDEVPLDGGVGLLAVAGISYGLKKLKDASRKPKDT